MLIHQLVSRSVTEYSVIFCFQEMNCCITGPLGELLTEKQKYKHSKKGKSILIQVMYAIFANSLKEAFNIGKAQFAAFV